MLLIWLAAWVPVTLCVHILVHEGAHALALRAFGVQGIRVQPYPLRDAGGAFLWGRTTWKIWPRATLAKQVVVLAAPVLAELWWTIMALSIAVWWHPASWEAVAALVDVSVWLLGAIRGRQGTDGARVVELLR